MSDEGRPRWLALDAFPSVAVARMVRARLEAEGLPAVVADETFQGEFAGLESVAGGIPVLVAPEHESAARSLLATFPLRPAEWPEPEMPLEQGATPATPESRSDAWARRALLVLLALIAGLAVAGALGSLLSRILGDDPGLPAPP